MTSEVPEKGTRWRHPGLRGDWIVATVGRKYISLSSGLPTLGVQRVLVDVWPGKWRRA